MIVLDTCALIYDALSPEKLSLTAKKAILHSEKKEQLFCSDISLWEIAMLISKKRLNVEVDTQSFLHLLLTAKNIQVLSINVEIAELSTTIMLNHFDPADRIIAATALHHHAGLVTCDKKLQNIADLSIIW